MRKVDVMVMGCAKGKTNVEFVVHGMTCYCSPTTQEKAEDAATKFLGKLNCEPVFDRSAANVEPT
jgi:hypothetical protein